MDEASFPYEYRHFMVKRRRRVDLSPSRPEKLRDRAIIDLSRPLPSFTAALSGSTPSSCIPQPAGQGIAYGRGSAFESGAGGRNDLQTKGASMSTQQQGGAQEPEAPEAPRREEPGQMPEEPGTAPEAPTMPEEPDDPSESPPDESGSP